MPRFANTWAWPLISPAAGACRRYSDAFADVLRQQSPPTGPSALLGLEHEYTVLDHGQVVDFRAVVHGLHLGQPHLDPADPSAYRLPSGAAVTADEAEAEIALPPTVCSPGFATRVAAAAHAERAALAARLPDGADLAGYSTHLSISVPAAQAAAVAELYSVTFAPAMMLLMDRPQSPGLLVRPRPGRLELGGEFVDGVRLRAAALFAVGSTRACCSALRARNAGADLPSRLVVAAQPDDRRYGWFVARDAFGADLYTAGRDCPLRTVEGAGLTAQQQLKACWRVARVALAGDASAHELAAVDRVVASVEPLPSEGPTTDTSVGPLAATCASPYGAAVHSRSRPGFDLAPVMLTWDTAVFVLANLARTRLAFAVVPGASLDGFLSRLDEGVLDNLLAGYVAQLSRGRRLHRRHQAGAGGLYDQLGRRTALLPRERAATRMRRSLRHAHAGRDGLHGIGAHVPRPATVLAADTMGDRHG